MVSGRGAMDDILRERIASPLRDCAKREQHEVGVLLSRVEVGGSTACLPKRGNNGSDGTTVLLAAKIYVSVF